MAAFLSRGQTNDARRGGLGFPSRERPSRGDHTAGAAATAPNAGRIIASFAFVKRVMPLGAAAPRRRVSSRAARDTRRHRHPHPALRRHGSGRDRRPVRQFSQRFARTLGPLPNLRRCVGRPLGPLVNSPSSFSRTLRPFPHLRRCRVPPLGPFAKVPRNFHEPSDRSPNFPRNFHEPSEGSPRGPPARKGPFRPFRSPPEGLWATFGPYPHGPWPFSTPRPTARRNSHGLFVNLPTPPLELPRSFRTLSTVRPSRHGFRGPLPPFLPRALGVVRSLPERWRPAYRARSGASMSPAPPRERRRLRDPRVIPASRMGHRPPRRAPGCGAHAASF